CQFIKKQLADSESVYRELDCRKIGYRQNDCREMRVAEWLS
ncbi:4338_t:CDS:1, partial [Cetraspora pellucida]